MQSTPKRAIWRPYTQELTANPPLTVERAEGAFLFTREGRKIFDGISSWWVITHGHCHPKIMEAIRRQAGRLDQVIFANFTHEPAEKLGQLLVDMTPAKLTRVFFSDNGSTAVEAALKMALQACKQRGLPKKTRFLAFSKSYHGDTVGAMSVSGDSLFNRPYRSTLFEVLRVNQPDSLIAGLQPFLLDFASTMEMHHDTIAGVILEPLLQGAGGMIVWPKEAVQQIAEICQRYQVLLLFDEVLTGFGRTGSLFAMDQLGICPDLVCLSKGLTGGALPLGVTVASEEIYQAFLSAEKAKMFFHGHSFTGNPLACAAAVANIEIFSEENTLDRIRTIEATNRVQLSRLAARVPVVNARTCGVVAAFEVAGKHQGYGSTISEKLTKAALERGLFVRPLGDTFYLLPPYSSSASALEEAWGILGECLSALPLLFEDE